uniref:Uncharacterized protein n=1 Tax=Craspedostauros australis TaxID=1486917 RepID=A0A7R9WM54_9STRA
MANNTTDDQDQRPTLKGVVFDMDGTLTVANLDFDDMYARCEIPKDHDILTYLNDNPANLTPQQIQAKFDIIQDMEREATQTLQLQPGVPEVLQWLSHNNIPMALITRNTMISVDGMYDKFPDLPRFEIVVTRDDAYAPKPDPAGMHAIRKQWNFDATSIVMIGDSYTNDVQFGKAAGVATIWLDLDATTESDAICNRFYKLARQLYLNFEISGIAELRKYPVPQPTTPATIAAAAGEFIGGDNAPDSTGNTPLIWAADAGHENVVAQLLQQGDSIDINARGYLGATAVCRAARRGHTAALKLLIEAGADLDIPNDKMQYPLHFAAFKEMPDAVNSLLDGGANGCVLDRKGRIPAMDTKNESIREQIMARMP